MPSKKRSSARATRSAENPTPPAALGGKTVLVTGGARRVGAGIARMLHAAGANVVIHYRGSAAEARALVGELNSARANSATVVQGDLLKVQRHAAVVEAALKAFGQLDVLVNNASSFYPTPVGKITEA